MSSQHSNGSRIIKVSYTVDEHRRARHLLKALRKGFRRREHLCTGSLHGTTVEIQSQCSEGLPLNILEQLEEGLRRTAGRTQIGDDYFQRTSIVYSHCFEPQNGDGQKDQLSSQLRDVRVALSQALIVAKEKTALYEKLGEEHALLKRELESSRKQQQSDSAVRKDLEQKVLSSGEKLKEAGAQRAKVERALLYREHDVESLLSRNELLDERTRPGTLYDLILSVLQSFAERAPALESLLGANYFKSSKETPEQQAIAYIVAQHPVLRGAVTMEQATSALSDDSVLESLVSVAYKSEREQLLTERQRVIAEREKVETSLAALASNETKAVYSPILIVETVRRQKEALVAINSSLASYDQACILQKDAFKKLLEEAQAKHTAAQQPPEGLVSEVKELLGYASLPILSTRSETETAYHVLVVLPFAPNYQGVLKDVLVGEVFSPRVMSLIGKEVKGGIIARATVNVRSGDTELLAYTVGLSKEHFKARDVVKVQNALEESLAEGYEKLCFEQIGITLDYLQRSRVNGGRG